MITLTVVGTGSSGNCYLLKNDNGKVLVLDAGLPIAEVKRMLNFNISCIEGVIVSHAHMDHSKAVKDFEMAGIPVIKPYEMDISQLHKNVGDFFISAFKVPHDDINCFGFLIYSGNEKIIYATDFEYIKYIFNSCRVNHFIVECNYQDKYVDLDAANTSHKLKGHCSYNTCKEFLRVNQTGNMKNVIFVHMGGATCDINECCEDLQATLGDAVKVDYARKGETYQL